VLLHPQAGSAIVAAIAEVYLHHEHQISDGTGKKPRLRQLLEHWSAEWYLEQVEKRMGYTLQRSPWEGCVRDDRGSAYLHLGVHPQRQNGLSYWASVFRSGAWRPGNWKDWLLWQNAMEMNATVDSLAECSDSRCARFAS
jgi:ferredoxin-nitrite reductase